MVGGLMVGAAMVAASFGNTIMHLYLCVGVIGGTVFYDCFVLFSSYYQYQCKKFPEVTQKQTFP